MIIRKLSKNSKIMTQAVNNNIDKVIIGFHEVLETWINYCKYLYPDEKDAL